MARAVFSVCALCCLIFAAPAAADDWKDCVKAADPEVRIESCSAIVARKNETPGNRAFAYLNRGHTHLNKGEHDRAIADFGRVLDLNPKYADAYRNRGNAYLIKGAYDLAIADYGRFLELNPRYDKAYYGRGHAHFDTGDFAKASADFLHVLDEVKDAAPPMLYRYLARARLRENAASELEANASRLKTKEWPYPVIELYLGKRLPGATLAAASKPEEGCEANFYIGEWHILQSQPGDAEPLLRKAAETCPKTFFEYTAAQAELKRLKP